MSLNNDNKQIFRCEICQKNYSSNSSLWNHNNKFHKSPCKEKILNSKENEIKSKENDIKSKDLLLSETDNKLKCKYCNKLFSFKQSKSDHERNYCKKKENIIIEEENNLLKKELNEIKENLFNLMQKQAKIHPKKLQKINNNLINNSNNIKNINSNNKIINICKFGSENISEILEKKEIFNILNSRYKALEESIKTVHFNKNRPELRNIYITNLRDNIAHVYNGNKFQAVGKHSILNELINNHLENIELSFENYREKLPAKTCEILDKFIEKIQNENKIMIDEDNNKTFKNYKEFKINEIKLMIYNQGGNMKEVINVIYDKPKDTITLREIEGDTYD
jgi:hypothetical protein